MIFIVILVLSTLSIAGTAAFFSVYGLAQLFQGMLIPVMIMGGALEIGKLVSASFLYRYWTRIGVLLRVYLVSAVLLLMVITSMGIFGMLSLGYQADTLPLKQVESQLTLLTQEQTHLLDRKKEIDAQIAMLPADYVRGRQKLMKSFGPEVTVINARLPIITNEMQKLNTQMLTTQSHVGPIVYIAQAFGQNIDDATKYMILLLIAVFDPLAVALTIGVNIALRLRKEDMESIAQLNENATDELNQSISTQNDQNNLTSDEIRMVIEEELKKIQYPTHENLIDPNVATLARKNQIVNDIRASDALL
jgi:hypothetical protein